MNRADVERAAAAVRARWGGRPRAAVVLGTGLGALGREIAVEAEVPYADIPGFPLSTVESHAGKLLLGSLEGVPVAAMSGRFHAYEGYRLSAIGLPVRVLHALGAETVILSTAVGGMHPLWAAGEVMLIADHLNLLGDNPLVGPNDDALGPRFPDMSAPYDPGLAALAREAALEARVTLREGVYVAVPGPSLETRAEYRFLRALGADVVGMSTVPEVVVAVHEGMKVLGLAVITDLGLPDALEPASLERILATAGAAEPKLTAVVRGVLRRLAAPARAAGAAAAAAR